MLSKTTVRFPALFLVFTLFAALVGCTTPTVTTAPTTKPVTLRIAMVVSGSAADGGWGSAGVEGLRQLRDRFAAEIDYKELTPHDDWDKNVPADWVEALRSYAREGYPLIFAHGRWFDSTVAKVAPEFPNTSFVVTGGSVHGANYASTTLKNEETGYLLGVLAASLSKDHTIGMIIGAQLRPMLSTGEAFTLGVQATNPSAKIIQEVLPNPGADNLGMNSPDGAIDVANKLIDEGADIIFTHAAAANVGVIQTAQKRNVRILNYGKDLTNIAPKNVVANGLQVIPVMMSKMTELYIDGKFEGKNYVMGLTEGAVKLSPLSNELVPADIQSHVAEAQQHLIDGTIKLEIQR